MIEQKPKYNLMPTGEKIIYTLYHADVLTYFKVKYIASVYVQNDHSQLELRATLKVVPNSTGRGIFEISSIVDSYVSPDYEGGKVLENTGNDFSHANNTPFSVQYHDIHRIDEYSTARNTIK